MSKTTVSASVTGLPDPPCRVGQLAQDAALIIDAYARADRKKAAEGSEQNDVILEMQMRVLNEKLDGIENAASFFPATSATGALFQLSLINHAVDLLESWVPEDSEHAGESDDARRAIVRMCYSIRDFVVSRTGANPEDGCGDYYMSERYNPHRLITAAIDSEDDADE